MEILPLVKIDPLLKPYSSVLEKRKQRAVLKELELTDGKKTLKDCVNNHLYYGLHKTDNEWIFREKAPNAKKIFLYGDFSAWQLEEQYSLTSIGGGDWELRLPLSALSHGMLYKLWMTWEGGGDERIPAYATRVVQDAQTNVFSAQVWDPKTPYSWQHPFIKRAPHHFIYEAHVGMSSQEPTIATYTYFKENILPKIKDLGYNAIQLMAVMEHPYYGSFGYQVSNFYAPSSRFGTPEELKELIDEAHKMDIAVILDIVHSHAVSNIKEGLSLFDGSEDLYFHKGSKGLHPVWDSRLFDYGKPDTLTFLLSNVKYWMEEFHFDGLRFDGVTSMCYFDHGIGVDFLNYGQYFDKNVDEDAICYLALANKLIKEVNGDAFSIAEDVSGMPGLAFPDKDGGVGFDYRISMGIADFWGKSIDKVPDERWNPGEIFFRLTDKRKEEHTISYAESHDQAMVGDKAFIFRLIDKEMYSSMSVGSSNMIVDRGIALHKIIRLLTLSLADGGYLNFMGNEFGHPEWIDFPRKENNWSYHHALRRWDLADDPNLKYHYLRDFDKALIHFIKENQILQGTPIPYHQNEKDQILAFERNGYLFVANLSPTHSYTDYEIFCPPGKYKIVLNTDNGLFGGFNNINEDIEHFTSPKFNGAALKLYLPARTGVVFWKN